jgi:hypothetical protein
VSLCDRPLGHQWDDIETIFVNPRDIPECAGPVMSFWL